MTLKEKFEEVFIENWLMDYAIECEKITEEFAIEFAKWLRYNNVETDYGWQNHGKQYSDTEIVKLFKEEKGL